MAKRVAETVRVAGGIEARWMARRQQWQVRLRYRNPITRKKETYAEAYVDAADENEARSLGSQQLHGKRVELTEKLDRAHASPLERKQLYTFEDFRDDVWKQRRYENLPRNSKDDHDQQWRKWMGPFLGGYTLAELAEDGADIGAAWIEWMQERGAGPATIEKVVMLARGILTRAIRWRYLHAAANPFAFLELPAAPFREEIQFALEIEHVCRIAWLTPGALRNTLWAELIGCEGMRQEEIGCALWSDFYLPGWKPRKRIRITKAISGSGRKREIKELKGKQSGRRNTDLFRTMLPLLDMVREQEEVDDISARVFACGSWDGLPDSDNWRDDFWAPAFERSGIPQDAQYGHITPHRLRGAAASALAYAGEPEHVVLDFLGHADRTTTFTWYQRAWEERDEEAPVQSMSEQIEHARRLALPHLRATVVELDKENQAIRSQLDHAVGDGARRALGATLASHTKKLNAMLEKLAALERIVGVSSPLQAALPAAGRSRARKNPAGAGAV